MNGINYIADTNFIVYLLDGKQCTKKYEDFHIGVSVITGMELLSYPKITTFEQSRIQSLLMECKIIPLDNLIKENAIKIRRKYSIKLPDSIVAATAISCKTPLITADKGFIKIEEIDLELIEVK